MNEETQQLTRENKIHSINITETQIFLDTSLRPFAVC